MRIRPTELGAKGILLVAALELAFLATAYSNLFFLLIAFSCVLGALGACWSLRNVAGLDIVLVAAPMAAAGAARTVSLSLRAPRRTRFDLAIAFGAAGTQAPLLHLPMLSGSATASGNLPGLPRGIHQVACVSIASRFPFGLFEVVRTVPIAVELVTHPAPIDPRAVPADCASQGDLAAALAGARSCDLAGLREFRPGDATGDIHWKATARRGHPIVKEREPGAADAVEVVVDRRCSAADLETALSTATAVLLAAAASARPALLRSQGTNLALGGAHRSPDALLRWLAAAATLPVDADPPPEASSCALRLPRNRAVEAARV